MNQVIENRIKAKIAKGTANAGAAYGKLIAEGKIAQDYILNVGTIAKGTGMPPIFFKPDPDNKVTGDFVIPGEKKSFQATS